MSQEPTLLYAANLHVGGAVQVATSIIAELVDIADSRKENLTIWVSTIVNENLQSMGVKTSNIARYEVVNHYGLGALLSGDRRQMGQFGRVLVIFGPLYVPLFQACKIVGFAQPWIIYPNTDAYQLLNLVSRLRTRFKFWLQAKAFRNSQRLIVELAHVQRGLIETGLANKRHIDVIPNCVGTVFTRQNAIDQQPLVSRGDFLTLGFLGRNYIHKNTAILPAVRRLLRERYGLVVRVLVTFTDEEWAACTTDFRSEVQNVGALSVVQCPSFYRSLDGVIFPSLLECFSATPLEALAMEIPLFASDRPFVRDVCDDFAIYFDPHSPEDAAMRIFEYFKCQANPERLKQARLHVLNFSSPKARAERYLELLMGNGASGED